MENLRKQKRHLQHQVENVEARLRNVEAQKKQYQRLGGTSKSREKAHL